ncbi:MAG TPA: diacylglycerol kinase family protein [Candidatus Xenobia bacterium]|jgi:YegS/Rv2252/BmrU family lipid kinase
MTIQPAYVKPDIRVPDTAFVFNPTSHSGRTQERWPDIQRFADELGLKYARYDTLPSGGTAALVEQLAASRQFQVIVSVGGDGTVSQVIQGIMAAHDKHQVPRLELPSLAIVPFGTGNDIAKSLGIPLAGGPFLQDLKKAVETIRFGADFKLDLGQIDGLYFADAFTLGFDSSVLQDRNREKERIEKHPVLKAFLRDYLLYIVVGLRRAVGYQAVPARLILDGEKFVRVRNLHQVIINNTKVYAGEFVFSKESRANDGLLEVVIFTGWPEYFSKMLASVRPVQLDDKQLQAVMVKHTRNYQARHIKIKLQQPKDSQLDGEVYRNGRLFEVTCIENALTLKTPVG